MPRIRTPQTSLGISTDNHLIVLWPHVDPRGEALVLRLPGELLERIVKQAPGLEAASCYFPSRSGYAAAARVALVCRHFYDLIVPSLYRHILSGFSTLGEWAPESVRARKFYRSIKNTPALRPLCRSIRINISDCYRRPTDEKKLDHMFIVLNDLVTMLPNVTSLSVQGGFGCPHDSNRTWDMVRKAARYMPNLQTLTIGRECYGLHLKHLFESGEEWPKLK